VARSGGLSRPAADELAVAVYGAAGHTGRFVVAELERRGLVPVAVGRDEAKLAVAGFATRGIETRLTSIDDPGSLDRAFAGAAAVVNCAGPFMDTADPVAALHLGIHYLGVTAEDRLLDRSGLVGGPHSPSILRPRRRVTK
jgi:short subunit dehydrogenase-like uncharacterized protein